VIAVDTNLLVYAHRTDSPFFARAVSALRSLVEGRTAWAIPWPCVHEFYGTVTHPRRYSPPSSLAVAADQLSEWLGSPSVRVIAETQTHWTVLRPMLAASGVKGGMVHDARIAAICLQHGVREFWTADRDFSRFPALKCHNPLIA
jgi:uncharacterized protein